MARIWQAESSSRFDPPDSSKGAAGPFQMMPRTAEAYGANPRSFVDSANAAGYMIEEIEKRNHWTLAQAVAGYNWGEGNLSHLLKSHQSDWLQYVPAETHDYVGQIAADMPGIREQLDAYNQNVGMRDLMRDMQKDWQRSNQDALRANIGAISRSVESRNARQLGIAVTVNNNTGGDATVAVSQLAH